MKKKAKIVYFDLELIAAIEASAKERGQTQTEWLRRAAFMALGWLPNAVPDEPGEKTYAAPPPDDIPPWEDLPSPPPEPEPEVSSGSEHIIKRVGGQDTAKRYYTTR